MNITAHTLMSLKTYSLDRRNHKQRLIAHRRERSVSLGPCMRLQFEDELTIRYQIQEVLHTERVDDLDDAQHEIDAYTHLVPDGSNWKATLLIELPDAQERARELPHLNEAAHRLYIELPRHPRVFALANEDLPDRHLTRPSAVHFLRFQFPAPLRIVLLAGAAATLGCAHDQYAFRRLIPIATMERLRCDLASRSITTEHRRPTPMNHIDTHPHGPSLALAQSEVGNVSTCSCGVVTITLHYMSLRFEPAAFRELLGMLNYAQRRLDGDPVIQAALQPPSSMDAPPVH